MVDIYMRKYIEIGKPFVKKVDSDVLEDAVRLCAEVKMENPNSHKHETQICYFEFEKKYEEYLCPERSDAFVLGLLTTAMENNMDIKYEAPISERLYYQLMTYYIPMISENNPTYPMHNIKLNGPTSCNPIKNKKAVATGCSGGVDSFYTIARHIKGNINKENELTHLIYNSICTSDSLDSRIKEVFVKTKGEMREIARECKLDLIACFTNLNKFYLMPYRGFNMFFTITYGSIALALQKLIGIYYASSGDPISEFNLNVSNAKGTDSSTFDVFTTQCMNTENVSFYSSGMEFSRMEKEQYIADFAPAQKNLSVCSFMPYLEKPETKYKNCSHCSKCLRTMVQFYTFNKLDNFKDVFNVEEFYNHKAKWIGKMMGTNKKSYVKDALRTAKINNVKIPFTSRLYSIFFYRPLTILKKLFRNSLFVRKIYYKFNIDYKLEGHRLPAYEVYKDQLNKKE